MRLSRPVAETPHFGTTFALGNVGRPDVDLTYFIRPDDVVAELEDRLRPFGRWRPHGPTLKGAACAFTGAGTSPKWAAPHLTAGRGGAGPRGCLRGCSVERMPPAIVTLRGGGFSSSACTY